MQVYHNMQTQWVPRHMQQQNWTSVPCSSHFQLPRLFLFSIQSVHNTSGQHEGCQWYILLSSMRRIKWLITWNGGRVAAPACEHKGFTSAINHSLTFSRFSSYISIAQDSMFYFWRSHVVSSALLTLTGTKSLISNHSAAGWSHRNIDHSLLVLVISVEWCNPCTSPH